MTQELDQYEAEEADDEHHELNPEAMRRAERELNKRDYNERAIDDVEDFMEDEDDFDRLQRRKFYSEVDSDLDEEDDARFIDPEECKGKLAEWIKEGHTKKYIKRKFINFV